MQDDRSILEIPFRCTRCGEVTYTPRTFVLPGLFVCSTCHVICEAMRLSEEVLRRTGRVAREGGRG